MSICIAISYCVVGRTIVKEKSIAAAVRSTLSRACIGEAYCPIMCGVEVNTCCKVAYVAVPDCRVELVGVDAVGASGVGAYNALPLAVYEDIGAAVDINAMRPGRRENCRIDYLRVV